MKPSRPLRVLFLALACSAALAAQAQGGRIDIPAGDLAIPDINDFFCLDCLPGDHG